MSELPRIILFVLVVAAPRILSAAAAESQQPRVFMNISKTKGLVYSPAPEYPKEALKNHWGGFGIFEVQFRGDGLVHAVFVTLSTGHKVLDDATVSTLRQWRSWKGYKMIVAMVPITFAPSGEKKKVSKRK